MTPSSDTEGRDPRLLWKKLRLRLWCLQDEWGQRSHLHWGATPPNAYNDEGQTRISSPKEALVRTYYVPHLHDRARADFDSGRIAWAHPTFETFVTRWPHLVTP